MTADEFRTILQEKLRLANARAKTESIDQHFWIGYREAIMDIMAADVIKAVERLNLTT